MTEQPAKRASFFAALFVKPGIAIAGRITLSSVIHSWISVRSPPFSTWLAAVSATFAAFDEMVDEANLWIRIGITYLCHFPIGICVWPSIHSRKAMNHSLQVGNIFLDLRDGRIRGCTDFERSQPFSESPQLSGGGQQRLLRKSFTNHGAAPTIEAHKPLQARCHWALNYMAIE